MADKTTKAPKTGEEIQAAVSARRDSLIALGQKIATGQRNSERSRIKDTSLVRH